MDYEEIRGIVCKEVYKDWKIKDIRWANQSIRILLLFKWKNEDQ